MCCDRLIINSHLKLPDFTVSDELNDREQRYLSYPLKPLHLGKDKPANEPETELRRKLCVKRATCCGTSEAIK